jgi:Hydrazine synthase alpha subunit middle domain
VPSRIILAGVLLLMAIAPGITAVETGSTSLSFLYTATKIYEPLAWLHGAERFPSGAEVFISSESGRHPLLPDFAASADPTVSFDGHKVLFSAKSRKTDPWQIWEVDIAGGAPRPITSFPEDCIKPFYLPDDRVVYARKIGGRLVIEAKELGSNKTLVLTYFPSSSVPTDVLRDGRILFESAYPTGAGDAPEIYTVYSDGSGVESYRCDHGDARHSARQLASGDTVFATSRKLARFTSARAQELTIAAPAGEYAGDVAETATGDWLLAWRPDTKVPYRLMRWTPGNVELKPLLAEPDINVVGPFLIAPRAIPNRHPSGLHDWPNANLLCLNAYTSKSALVPGSIHSVRLFTRDHSGHPKLMGTATVERDGSFFVQVPSEQQLQFELLDTSGKSLHREAGYFWMRRGEQRVCVGCHVGPETSPENAVPQILLKSTTPSDLTGTSAASAGGH